MDKALPDTTVVYYTSNKQPWDFEKRIQRRLLKTIGGLPLISVSQKPMNLGDNICVGSVGASSQNAYRQLLIGAAKATTRFIAIAEADCVYSPDYFFFQPPRDDTFYLAKPLYVLFAQRGKAKVFVNKPRGSESTMVANRQLLMDRLEFILKDIGEWGTLSANGDGWPYLLERNSTLRERFITKYPSVTFKTDHQMHRRTPHDVNSKTREIPYWGTATNLIRRFT